MTQPTADDAAVQPMVGDSLCALADLLDGSPAERWDQPSLCAGWQVRHVVAHMTMAARYSGEEFTARLREAQFDFTRVSDQIAAQDADLPTGQLIGDLRSPALHAWIPPGGGVRGALNHAVVHGLDVTVALGERRTTSDAALRVVLDDLTRGGGHEHFGTDVDGRTLVATDLDWTHGEGPELRGPADAMASVLCGRTVPDGLLTGAPLAG